MPFCTDCGSELRPGHGFCTGCGSPTEKPVAQPVPSHPHRHHRPDGPPRPAPAGNGHHSPGLALFFGLLLPGAGQAYNGRPWRGFLVLLASFLVVPWVVAAVMGMKEAQQLAATGERGGRGGGLWVFFHAWLVLNVAMAAANGLTIAGVLS